MTISEIDIKCPILTGSKRKNVVHACQKCVRANKLYVNIIENTISIEEKNDDNQGTNKECTTNSKSSS